MFSIWMFHFISMSWKRMLLCECSEVAVVFSKGFKLVPSFLCFTDGAHFCSFTCNHIVAPTVFLSMLHLLLMFYECFVNVSDAATILLVNVPLGSKGDTHQRLKSSCKFNIARAAVRGGSRSSVLSSWGCRFEPRLRKKMASFVKQLLQFTCCGDSWRRDHLKEKKKWWIQNLFVIIYVYISLIAL